MKRQLKAVAAIGASLLLTACATTTPQYDARFSDSVRMAQARQTADAGATARNASKDAAGIDGAAARATFDRYLFSFTRPQPQPNVFTIGVTGGGGR